MLVAASAHVDPAASDGIEPFHGEHQAGILTRPQRHSVFAAFDVVAEARDPVIGLLQAWTRAAARMTGASLSGPAGVDPTDGVYGPPLTVGTPNRLTLTFGFGAGLFEKDGRDRYGLAPLRPAALVDLPSFRGDRLDPARCGGDLSAQACADDPQTVFLAMRELVRLAHGRARLCWMQTGFLAEPPPGQTARTLIGFQERPEPGPEDADAAIVQQTGLWVADEGPAWMRGGTYLVTRRIGVAVEHWDRMTTAFQEQVIGRAKESGAPLPPAAQGATPVRAHAALGRSAARDGARLWRRSYSYDDGARLIADPWPPWHQGVMFDAGVHFLAYQRDPRIGFIPVYETMAQLDALNQFVTHTGSGVFACPPGVRGGGYIGESLLGSGS